MAAQKRDVYKAAEVCQLAELQPYVLRTWEAEFPKLGTPGPGGVRVYGQGDLDLVLQIKALVYGEGLTLAGARRRLDEEGGTGEVTGSEPLVLFDDTARERLRQVRRGLTEILDLLGGGAPQLQLVSAAPAGKTSAAARPVARKRKTPA